MTAISDEATTVLNKDKVLPSYSVYLLCFDKENSQHLEVQIQELRNGARLDVCKQHLYKNKQCYSRVCKEPSDSTPTGFANVQRSQYPSSMTATNPFLLIEEQTANA